MKTRQGYYLFITRRQFRASKEGPEIGLNEWLSYVAADPSLLHWKSARLAGIELPVFFETEGLTLWSPTKHDVPGEIWFDWNAGNVEARNPDEKTRRKMWLIAQALGAQVIGQEDESYDADGEAVRRRQPFWWSRRHWWKFW